MVPGSIRIELSTSRTARTVRLVYELTDLGGYISRDNYAEILRRLDEIADAMGMGRGRIYQRTMRTPGDAVRVLRYVTEREIGDDYIIAANLVTYRAGYPEV